jgi:hypothetical protein
MQYFNESGAMAKVFTVSNASQPDSATQSIDVGGSNSTSNTSGGIDFTASFSPSANQIALNLASVDAGAVGGSSGGGGLGVAGAAFLQPEAPLLAIDGGSLGAGTELSSMHGNQGIALASVSSTTPTAAGMLAEQAGIKSAAPTTFTVSNESQLNAAIASIDITGSNSASNASFTIDFAASFSLSSDPLAFNLASGDVVTINGGNFTMDGGSAHRGFFVYAGSVDINDLTIQNTHAVGGAGSFDGGGGGGLGGGLFIAVGGAAAISNVTFLNDAATGGAGGHGTTGGILRVGAGGGMGGAGGTAGGGGGIGGNANGGSYNQPAGKGIVVGASGGGAGYYGANGAGSGGGGGGGGYSAGGGGGIGGGNGYAASAPTSGGYGGYGGGGGGFDEIGVGRAGDGGFGGGGGGSGSVGGNGGFGGGGGAGGGALEGAGGFGAGRGGSDGNTGFGGGGGGGLGAGGDIFVQQGGSLTVDAGSLGAGTVQGGAAGTAYAGGGSGLGSGIFIQGNQGINFAPAVSTTLTIAGVIADQQSSGGSGRGHLTIDGSGTVDLTANNSYAGGTTLTSGSLELGNAHAAGSGEITFGGAAANLLIDAGAAPSNTLGGLQVGDTIDLKGIGLASGSNLYGSGTLTVSGTSTVTLNLDSALGHSVFGVASDGAGGTLLTVKNVDVPTTFNVGSEAQLNAAIAAIDVGGGDVLPNIAYTINLTGGFTLSSDPDAINLGSGDTLTIQGNGATISGGGSYRGLFVYSGQVDIDALTIASARAIGGKGGSAEYGGGGGAGLGGGLFVASGGTVTLAGVSFTGDSATGGAGGAKSGSGGGGGGGLGGAGGNGRFGGGGGVGQGATGNGSAGIVIGAASGGSSASGAGGADGGGGAAGSGGGGGGGVGGASGSLGYGANGGFGGGGAGGVHAVRSGGGNGGFGGGGGGYGNQEGNGGFGGGGGAYHAAGFGGGAGNGNASNGGGGGGGLGAGGDIFVQQGGSLTIETGSLATGTVKGGTGGSSAGTGSAYGTGLFIQGNQTVTLAPTSATTLSIAGVIADQSGSGGSGLGSLDVAGAGTVDLTANNTYAGGTTLSSGVLELGSAHAAGGGAITFAGATAKLVVDLGDAPAETLKGLAIGDQIDLKGIGLVPGSTVTAQGSLTVTGSSSVTLTLDPALDNVTFGIQVDGSGGTLLTVEKTACYCRGTRIRTMTGEIPIEDLRIGDLVLTASGEARAVRWLGHRALDCTCYSQPNELWPIRIQAGAFGERLPVRDLWVSPGHSILVDGALIHAQRLINGASIVQVPRARVEYWHLELDSHDILLAEGLPAESYLDMGNRTAFVNGGAFLDAHPDFAPKQCADFCRPQVLRGPALHGAKAALLARAHGFGYEMTEDADVHVICDGARIEPVRLGDTRLAFMLPATHAEMELRCRSFTPAHMSPESDDERELGICVSRLQIDGIDLALAHTAAFERGWHALEGDGDMHWRWTKDRLPIPAGTRLLVIDTHWPGHYWGALDFDAKTPGRNTLCFSRNSEPTSLTN